MSGVGGKLAAVTGGLVVIALLAACSDDGYGTDPTEMAPAATGTPESASALPLDRFHYAATLTLREQQPVDANEVVISTEGDYQSPDRSSFTHTIRTKKDTFARSAVVVGETAWLRLADGPWQEKARSDEQVESLVSAAFSPLRPSFLGGPSFEDAKESARRLTPQSESVNGVPANHYQVGAAGREFIQTFLSDEQLVQRVQDLTWDLWLAEDGAWPVRLVATGGVTTGHPALDQLDLQAPIRWELRIEISRPNDPALVVAPPR
jgi:hypothetical protein